MRMLIHTCQYKFLLFFLVILFCCCKKFIEVDPPKTELVQKTVFADSTTATAAILGIYNKMISGGFAGGGFTSVSCLTGFSCDELSSFTTSSVTNEFYTNNLTPSNSNIASLWQ